MKPRPMLFLGLALVALVQLCLIRREGWNGAWQRWHVPARAPHFSDLRAITGALDSVERGFDPREKNPGAPFGQRFNQTHVWLWLGNLGLREANSTAIGLVILAGYVVGLWWLCSGIDRATAILLVPVLLSPAALLAIERGTTDLSVFLLLAFAVHVARRSMPVAMVGVGAAFVLKLFPLAGVLLALREPRRRALWLGLTVLGLAAVFCALNFRELVDIAFKTEKGQTISYGWAILSLYLGRHLHFDPDLALDVRWACGAFAAIGLVVAAWRGLATRDETPPTRALDFFRVGAAVYAGTFALGASWDYRLIFCAFAVPQLAAWARDGDASFRRPARLTLAALLIAAWTLAAVDWFGANAAGAVVARTLEEFSKWSLFFGCVYFLARTLPAWLKPASPARARATP
ncbi:MAG TPA: glycosyltransferase 87 family protein [Opitutaceae bacterium]|nr:glycosyltransferase 87 family protein [Opitutaceae bacterium]